MPRMRNWSLMVSTVLFVVVGFGQQHLEYLEYDKDLPSPAECRTRRDSLMSKVGNESVVILFSGPVRNRNNDVEFQYRQDDHFYYLTGFTEPNAVLVLIPKGVSVRNPDDTTKLVTVRELMFVQARNPMRERWDGRRYGPEAVMKLRGITYAATNDKLQSMIGRVVFGGTKYVYLPPIRQDIDDDLAEVIKPLRQLADRWSAFVELRDPTATISKMRAVKSAVEIDLLRTATKISATAHSQAMRSIEPGMREYEVMAVYEYVFRRMGAEYGGYPSIVGSGENSVILHYSTDRGIVEDGDLLLADCAAEYRGYSSDVTRTYPANGEFSKPQREIYDVVLAAQDAAIAKMAPGVAWMEVSAAADDAIQDGLLKLGLIKEKNGREFRKFYWHGLGHPVGLNVHDVSVQTLEPGVLYTVEPGIYIPAGTEGVDTKYYDIGVRIEDVVLITQKGHEILSADAPRDPGAIEALMKKKGIGNEKLE